MRTVLMALLLLAPALRADQLDDKIRSYMRSQKVPGVAVAVVQHGQIAKIGTYGVASVEWNQPVVRSTPFWLDSLTKLFTAVGIMQLAEQGKISLDDPISKHLPDTPASWHAVTIRHLLNHSSGIKDAYWEQYKGSMLIHYAPEDVYAYALKAPLEFPPGDREHYCNEGYYLLGIIIEKVTQTPYPRWMKDHVLAPAGMKNAFFYDAWKVVPGMVSNYELKDGEIAHNREDIISDRGDAIASWGLYASLDDMIAFDAAVRGGRLISPKSLGDMWANALLNGGGASSSGIGFSYVYYLRGHRLASKGGSAGTLYAVLPEDDLSIILLTNLQQDDMSSTLRSIAASLLGVRLISELQSQPDPDPKRTALLRQSMTDVANGGQQPLLTPQLAAQLTPELSGQTKGLLQVMSPLTFLLCEKPGPKDPYGVESYCYYRVTAGSQVMDLVFGLAPDSRIATVHGEPH